MPKIYSLSLKRCMEISDAQWEFMESIALEKGNIEKALSLQLVSQDLKDSWKADQDFWSSATAISDQLARAHQLNLAYIKDALIATIEGSKKPDKIQMQAINASIKLLQTGGAGIRSAKMEVTPNSFSVSFEEGTLSPEGQDTQEIPDATDQDSSNPQS